MTWTYFAHCLSLLVPEFSPLQARLAAVEGRIRDLEAELAAAKAEVSCGGSPMCCSLPGPETDNQPHPSLPCP